MSSIKDLFGRENTTGIIKAESAESLTSSLNIESLEYIEAYEEDRERYFPPSNFYLPQRFARFGSAEKYYENAAKRIYQSYPYDGSLKERVSFHNSGSYFDRFIFEYQYPRTTGYAKLCADGWGTKVASYDNYGAPATASFEYISINGGPNPDPEDTAGTKFRYKEDRSSGPAGPGVSKANIYDENKNRTSNLLIDGRRGNTVEFWMKKAAFATSKTGREVIFDSHTPSHAFTSEKYGRFTLEMTGTISTTPFLLTYMSGTSGISQTPLGISTITTSSVADDNWHHYAVTVKNNGTSNLLVSTYVDGVHFETLNTGSVVNQVSGTINANIGALITPPSGTTHAVLGYGKLSASLDEFRFWKKERTAEQVGLFYKTHVGGGTNTDDANLDLGVYFKFNEGITGQTGTDSTVLDYSGRASNGTWTGYDSSARDLGSAITESGASTSEFKDPIIYDFHPDVDTFIKEKTDKGKSWDSENNASLIKSFPDWIVDEDDGGDLSNLTQIIASYFDQLMVQVEYLPKLKQLSYPTGSLRTQKMTKPLPFSDKLLDHYGMEVYPIFEKLSGLERYLNRDDQLLFDTKLDEIKNQIYQNIYLNLVNIYKSKGTERAFRNLIRCFGIDEDVIKFNLYGDGITHTIEDNYRPVSLRKRAIDFDNLIEVKEAASGTPYHGVVINFSSGSSLSASVIHGADTDKTIHQTYANLACTTTAEVFFTNKDEKNNKYSPGFNSISSSLFGSHQTTTASVMSWLNERDLAAFQVYAVRDKVDSRDAKFVCTDMTGNFYLVTDTYQDVYDNTKWTLAVSARRTNHGTSTFLSGTSAAAAATGDDGENYILEFTGINNEYGVERNSFTLTHSFNETTGSGFATLPKRLYVGAHRQNWTGSVVTPSDVAVSYVRHYLDYVTPGELRKQANYSFTKGKRHPVQNNSLANAMANFYGPIPNFSSLILDWDFEAVTGSNASGQFNVFDFSYTGSVKSNNPAAAADRFPTAVAPWHSASHQGLGFGFHPDSTKVSRYQYLPAYKPQLPETLSSDDTVNVLTNDDEFFTRDTRPIQHLIAFEKSPYQAISEEMINFMATVVDFSNLYGEPVEKYRMSYKPLGLFRKLFFDRVENENIDIDRYFEYYRWFDGALSRFLAQLAPASAAVTSRILNVVESHALERSKYQYKFPTMEAFNFGQSSYTAKKTRLTFPVSNLHHISVQQGTTLAPVGGPTRADGTKWEAYNSEWGDANGPTSGDATTDSQLQTIKNTIVKGQTGAGLGGAIIKGNDDGTTQVIASQHQIGQYTTPAVGVSAAGSFQSTNAIQGQGGIKTTLPSVVAGVGNSVMVSGGPNAGVDTLSDTLITEFASDVGDANTQKEAEFSDVATAEEADDVLYGDAAIIDNIESATYNPIVTLTKTAVPNTTKIKAKKILPFTLKARKKPYTGTDYKSAYSSGFTNITLEITDVHHDGYRHSDYETPMQGPFTEKYVGGRQHRHATLNRSATDTVLTRAEAFKIDYDSSSKKIVVSSPQKGNANLPRAVFSRDEFAKRPVNIRNIHMTGSSPTVIGNFYNRYEYVNLVGRRANNRWLKDNEVALSPTADKTELFTLIQTPYKGGLRFNFILPASKIGTDTAGSVFSGFTLLDRNATTSSVIFAERFSAPGGPEVLSRGFMDRASEEYSPYNALPYRNLTVRKARGVHQHTSSLGYESDKLFRTLTLTTPLDTLYRNRMGRVGLDTAGLDAILTHRSPSGSFHKVNPNRRRILRSTSGGTVITSSIFDNGFVNRPIPASDRQYMWITGSLLSGTTSGTIDLSVAPFGYFPIDGLNEDGTESEILWHSQSILYIASTGDHKGNYVFLNNLISGKSTYDTNDSNVLSFGDLTQTTIDIDLSREVNSTLLALNGPYGYPGWKQIKTAQHPVAVKQRKDNTYTKEFIETRDLTTNSAFQPYKAESKIITIERFRESPVTSKHKPIQHRFTTDVEGTTQDIIFNHSYTNNFARMKSNTFNKRLSTTLEETPVGAQTYDSFVNIYRNDLAGAVQESVGMENLQFSFMKYKETLFPKDINTYLSGARGRTAYAEEAGLGANGFDRVIHRSFWRDDFGAHGDSATPSRMDGGIKLVIETEGSGPGSMGQSPTVGRYSQNRWRTAETARNSLGYVLSTKIHANSNAETLNLELPAALPFFMLTGFTTAQSGTAAVPGSAKMTASLPATLSRWPLDEVTYGYEAKPIKDDSQPDTDHLGINPPLLVHTTQSNSTPLVPGSTRYFYGYRESGGELAHDTSRFIIYSKPTASIYFNRDVYNSFDIVTASLSRVTDALRSNIAEFTGSVFNYKTAPYYRANKIAKINPWYDNYDDYADDLRVIGKDYSIIPEFRLSKLVEEHDFDPFSSGNPLDVLRSRNDVFTIDGATEVTASGDTKEFGSGDFSKAFFDDYLSTDSPSALANKVSIDHQGDAKTDLAEIEFNIDVLNKFLPYHGLYPATRATRLASLLSQSIGPYMTVDEDVYGGKSVVTQFRNEVEANKLRALYQPLFAPGIFFNTIKAGVAVDWPIYTGSIPSASSYVPGDGLLAAAPLGASNQNFASGSLTINSPNYRLPFESIFNLNEIPSADAESSLEGEGGAKKFVGKPIFYVEPSLGPKEGHYTTFIGGAPSSPALLKNLNKLHFKLKSDLYPATYRRAMENFLAGTVDFFMQGSKPTSFTSKRSSEINPVVPGVTYYMDVVLEKREIVGKADFVSAEGPTRQLVPRGDSGAVAPPGPRKGYIYGPPAARTVPISSDGDFYLSSSLKVYAQNAVSGNVFDGHEMDPCYAPYTPPYFYGSSVLRIAMSASANEYGTGDVPLDIDQILDLARRHPETETFNTFNSIVVPSTDPRYSELKTTLQGTYPEGIPASLLINTSSTAYKSAMSITSSVRCFDKINSTTPGSTQETNDNTRWTIRPKFECPIIDVSASSYIHNDSHDRVAGPYYSRRTGRSVWMGHGKPVGQELVSLTSGGETTSLKKGIVLTLKDSFPDQLDSNNPSKVNLATQTGSLLSLCGFDKAEPLQSKYLSEMKDKGEVSEAFVMIPYITKEIPGITERIFVGRTPEEMHVIKLNTNPYMMQLVNVLQGKNAVEVGDVPNPPSSLASLLPIKDTTVSTMIKMARKYVLPPEIDFINRGFASEPASTKLGLNTTLDFSDAAYQGSPFVMYIIENEAYLTRNGMSNIWQNLLPRGLEAEGANTVGVEGSADFVSGVAVKKKTINLKHIVAGHRAKFEFFGMLDDILVDNPDLNKSNVNLPKPSRMAQNYNSLNEILKENIKFLIFKVKMRAAHRYNSLFETPTDTGETVNVPGLTNVPLDPDRTKVPDASLVDLYSFNWPHDYYSVGELAKVNVSFNFGDFGHPGDLSDEE